MARLIKLKHEKDYYWGLTLLLLSCFALVWALWRDAFKPQVFLGGFLLFAWGYALLWRHDYNQNLASLRRELEDLKAQWSIMNDNTNTVPWAQELHEQGAEALIDEEPEGETLLPTEF